MHPVYRANGYNEIFMDDLPNDPLHRLRHFPNAATYEAYGYDYDDYILVDKSWFYNKRMWASIGDVLNNDVCYPASWTPNFKVYINFFGNTKGGALSLSDTISQAEYNYCGLSFVIPFAGSVVSPIIPTSLSKVDYEDRVKYYNLYDEPVDKEIPDATILSWYDNLKAVTAKPVGCIFSASDHLFDSHLSIVNKMDLAMVDMYPYQTNGIPWAQARVAWLVSRLRRIKCPVIVVGQATSDVQNGVDPGESGIDYQYNAYRNAGYPISWYSWNAGQGHTSIKLTYQAKMRSLYI